MPFCKFIINTLKKNIVLFYGNHVLSLKPKPSVFTIFKATVLIIFLYFINTVQLMQHATCRSNMDSAMLII